MSKRIEGRRWGRQRRPAQGETSGREATAPPAPSPSFWQNRRTWLILFLCLAGSTALSYAIFKYVVVQVPPELVGTWEVKAGPLRGWSLEFRPDATAVATRVERGQKIFTDYVVKVEGKTMWLTSWDEKTGKDETVTQTILELTAEELVIRDEDQRTYQMKRVGK